MNTNIVYCTDQPVLTTISDWFKNVGRIAVGRKTGKKREVEILAYSDNENDSPILRRYAKQQGALYIRSISSEGVTAID